MRLWSIHPKYLDAQGIVALWRETLLAQAVLRNETKGYRNHPQLERFKSCNAPLSAISIYLKHMHEESENRGYSFNKSKIGAARKTNINKCHQRSNELRMATSNGKAEAAQPSGV
jgi:hypothetical protein